MTRGIPVLAYTFESQCVGTGIGPEVHKVKFPKVGLGTIEIQRFADLNTVQIGLVYTVVIRPGQFQDQSQGLFLFNLEGNLKPALPDRLRLEEKLSI